MSQALRSLAVVVATVLLLAVLPVSAFRAVFGRPHVSALHAAPPATNKTPLVANGKRIEVDPGSSLSQACSKLGLKVPTDCRKGECGVCTVSVGGVKIKSCVGKVPPAPKLKSLLEKGLPVTL